MLKHILWLSRNSAGKFREPNFIPLRLRQFLEVPDNGYIATVGSGLLVGCGSIGKRHLSELLQRYSKVFVVDINQEVRRNLEIKFGNQVSTFSAISELPNTELDLAVISTWGPDHLSHLKSVLMIRPRFILIEKPLESSLYKVSQISQLLQDSKVPYAVNFSLRYNEQLNKILPLASQYNLGKITNISVSGGANCISTNGIHYLDFFMTLLKTFPESVMADIRNDQINPRNRDLSFFGGVATWRLKNGVSVTIDFSSSSYSQPRILIFFERGLIDIYSESMKVFSNNEMRQMKNLPITRTKVFDQELETLNLADPGYLDGITILYSKICSGDSDLKFDDQIEGTKQILLACISSKLERKVYADETFSEELLMHDWKIS